MPCHHLSKLTIAADRLPIRLSASQLFGAAADVQLFGAGRAELLLPLPDDSRPWRQLLAQAQRTGGVGVDLWLLAKQCAFALLAAFRSAARLQTAQLCSAAWVLLLPLRPAAQAAAAVAGGGQLAAVAVSPRNMLLAVEEAFAQALGQFGRLRTTDSKMVHAAGLDELQLSLRRSRVGPAAIRSCGLIGTALSGLLYFGGVYFASVSVSLPVLRLWYYICDVVRNDSTHTVVVYRGPPLAALAGIAAALYASSLYLYNNNLDKLLLGCT